MPDPTDNINNFNDDLVEEEQRTVPMWETQTEAEAFEALPNTEAPAPFIENRALIPAIQNSDTLLLDYPAMAENINNARAKGFSDAEIRRVLAKHEMANGYELTSEEMDKVYGRSKESRTWSTRAYEKKGAEEISKLTGLKEDDIYERNLVADKLGLSRSAMLDNDIYKVARDQVTVIDDFITAGIDAAKSVQLNQQAARLVFNSMGRDLTAEEQAQLDAINKEIAKYSNVVYTSKTSDIAAATTNLVAQQAYGMMSGAKWLPAYVAAAGAANLAYAGAAGAMLNPLGATAVGVKSFAEGVSMAALAGAFENSTILETSGIYQDLMQIPGINKKVAALIASAGGALNGYIEVGNLATMFKTIPGMKKLGDVMGNFFKGAAGEAIKEGGGMRTLLAAPSIRSAIIEGLKNYVEGVTSETQEEIQQAFVSILARELTTRAYKQEGKSLRECVKELMDEGTAALGQMAKGMAPGALINTVSASYHANKAARAARAGGTVLQGQQSTLTGDDKARYDAVQQSLQRQNTNVDTKQEAKAAPSSEPEAAAPAGSTPATATQETTTTEGPTIEATTPEGAPESAPPTVQEETAAPAEAQEEVGSDTVFIKTEALDEYMQSLPPADQRTLQEALGWQTIEKSEATGEYFIPGEKFRAAVKQVKGLNNAVGMDLRQGVQGVTLREQQQAMERLRQLTSDPMESSEPYAVEAQNVREDLVKQLRGGGQSAELARANADLMSHYIFNFARTLAMNDDGTLREGAPGPQALYEKLQIKSEKGVQQQAQQTGTRYEQSAVSDALNTEHGWGAAVNEKGQPVGGNKRYEQTAWHGTGENAVIERFSREKSNSGAGGNAHGAGALYGAQDRQVAAGYREEMSDTEFLFTKDGQKIDPKLAGALSRHVNSIRNVAADGLALDEDSRVLKDLADVQELAKGTRAGKTFMARLISQYQTLLDRIDADPEMTPQDFYNLRNEAPFRDDDMAPSNIADAYHAATQNAIRAGKPAATIEDVRHVIEEGLLPNKLWRDELYADAELLANADLTGIRVEERQSGALYEVEIPENDVLLNEQLRFSAQPKVVKDGIRAAFEKLTHEQKRDFAENILPWSEAKDKVFTSQASGIKTVLDYLNKPEEYINGLFKDISDPRAIPPRVVNAFTVLRKYFQYTTKQLEALRTSREAAMAEAERAIANVDEARARLQEEYDKAHAEEVAREEAFFKKELFTKLRNSRTIEGRDIYDAFAYALRGDNFENQMAASLALNDAGIKGVTYDGVQDGRCFVIFDEDAIEIVNRYQQEKAQGQARGYIEFGKNGESIIGLLKDADQSTFIHEMGHMMLENLVRFGQDKDASAQVKRDLQTALEFLGIKDASEIRVEHHEMFARAFEVYLMTAKAPNSKLWQVFAKMKRWLLSIYHQARVLNAEINPALQDLFDRMLAGPVEEDGGNTTLNELQEASTVAAERIKALEAEIESYKHEPRDARRAFTAGRKVGTEMQKLRMSEKLAALREKYALREERRKERLAEMKQRQKERAALKKEIQRIVKSIEKARKQKSIIWAARQEIEKLLEGYTLKKPSPERMAKAQYLYDYLVDHPDGPVRFEDYAPEDQEAIRMLGTTTLPDMTVDELRQLAAKVEEIRQRGREAYERWKAEKQARRNGMFNDCFTALGKIPDEGKVVRGPQDLRKEYKGIKGALQKVGDWTYAATLGSHRLFDWIGNGKGLFKSAWTKYFVEAVNAAHDEYLRNANDRREKMEAVLQENGLTLRDLSRSRVIDGQQYTVDEMLSVYALLQNEKGAKALLYGNFKGLADPHTHAAHIIQALTPQELAVANAVLDDYDQSFDRLNQRFIEVYNDGMVKEENYSPMKRLEYTTNEGIMDSEDADMFAGRTAMQGVAAMVTSLEKGFLIKRMEISEENQQPVDLGLLSIWNEQVTAQEHTAAFAQLAGDLTSVLYRRDEATGTSMAKAIRMTKGSEAWQSVIGYTNLVIMNEARAAHNVLNKLSSTLGRNMSMVYLAGSISVYLKQWMSLPRFLLSGNPMQLLATVGDYMRRPRQFMDEVYKLDPQIKERIPNAFYKLTKIDPTTAGEWGYISEEMLKKLMFLGAYQDRVTAAIGWKAVYDSEIKRGRSQKEAVQAAQRAVALTQQVPNLKDMPAFWRQSGLAKLMMIFSSNSVPLWGMTAYDMVQAIKRGDIPESFWTIMGLTAAAMGTAMVVSGPPSGDDDDTWWNWFLSAMTEQTITSLPVIGKEIYAAYDELINKNRRGSTYSALVTPFVKSAQGIKRMMADDSDNVMQSGMSKFEAGAWQAAEGLGLLLGYMPVTMARRIRTAMSSEDGWQAIQTLCAIRKNQQVKKAVSW